MKGNQSKASHFAHKIEVHIVSTNIKKVESIICDLANIAEIKVVGFKKSLTSLSEFSQNDSLADALIKGGD